MMTVVVVDRIISAASLYQRLRASEFGRDGKSNSIIYWYVLCNSVEIFQFRIDSRSS